VLPSVGPFRRFTSGRFYYRIFVSVGLALSCAFPWPFLVLLSAFLSVASSVALLAMCVAGAKSVEKTVGFSFIVLSGSTSL
jgi:hypothetical protein